MGAAEWLADDPAAQVLWLPIERGEVAWPAHAGVLFLGARSSAGLLAHAADGLVCQQDFRPFADALERQGLQVVDPPADARFALVMLLPPRQREARRALFARALEHVAPGGSVLAAVSNREGARSAQEDLQRLVGPVQNLSKHKCRVFWAQPDAAHTAWDVQRAWRGWDALRPTTGGLVSRPGLFAWDRVDAGSAMLAAHLPRELAGPVADLGAGSGYLSVQLIARCPDVTAIDLLEADARALAAARVNVGHALTQRGRDIACAYLWHDVTAGLPRLYDHIVSNPPFHLGRADQPGLGRAFIAAAAAGLRSGGSFWMVANRHLAYEAALHASFAQARSVATGEGFKVIEARR